jgi:hypothetical protein
MKKSCIIASIVTAIVIVSGICCFIIVGIAGIILAMHSTSNTGDSTRRNFCDFRISSLEWYHSLGVQK